MGGAEPELDFYDFAVFLFEAYKRRKDDIAKE